MELMGIKILHIVAGDISGGAARGAYWLHRELLQQGVESKMILQNVTGDETNVMPIAQKDTEKVLKLFRIYMDQLPVKLYRNRDKFIFSTGIFGFDITKLESYQWADIIHLHWINNGMINIKSLSKVNKPIVWTFRDMWPLTGGCHYPMECRGYETGCGSCTQLKSINKFDLSHLILKLKKRHISKEINIVSISRWLGECVKNSDLFQGFDVNVIHNGVDINEYFPVNRQIARGILGLPNDKRIVLLGATNLHQKYKGFGKFQEALQYIDKNNLFLFFGEINNSGLDELGIEHKELGFLNDSVSLRLAYSAADVFVAPSVQEAFGKTLIEAMACGTPVVAFDATGPKDIVEHKQTGYLAQPFDSYDLAKGIQWVLQEEERLNALSFKSIQKVKKDFTVEVISKKYIQLYEEILDKC